ncbi:hypothetical protein [Natronoglycomyces albus]|uniref:Uncharacterized protein n=1 Tax=Natronoglycomyces albus TaxID=2811108 RepID=A0A895XKL5_9ACTN|nr:hypothetical protein [Natronoglycomyces albus]QSB05597.1 hypothetical protein JQS30_01310 [Natronoglycomyces albus]
MGQSEEARRRLDSQLTLGNGFEPDEREEIIEEFVPLGKKLAAFDADAVSLTVSVTSRETPDQEVTLQCTIYGEDERTVTGTSAKNDLVEALVESRRRVTQQLRESEVEQTVSPLRRLFGGK